MDSTYTLEPCPFCGAGNSRVSLYEMEGYWRISCGACGSTSGILPVKYQNARERLVKSWNNRPDTEVFHRVVSQRENLAILLRRCLHQMSKERLAPALCEQVGEYLERHGLSGSILRGDGAPL